MRYIPHTSKDIEIMLNKIGVDGVDDLFDQIPEALRLQRDLDLPAPMSEAQLMSHLTTMSGGLPAEGRVSFLGAGMYGHHVSPTVDQILLRSEFYTAYTPYQPEVSQGTLQAIFEFQTMIARVFGMWVANASMYDGATTAAEAALMARRVNKRSRILLSEGLHPEYVETIRTFLQGLDNGNPDVEMIPLDPVTGMTDLDALNKRLGDNVAAVITGYPNFRGVIEPLGAISEAAHKAGALAISSTPDPFALGLVKSPGDLGVDIATGEGQSLGVPISFGGPGLGLFTIRNDKKLLRQLPGRVCGETVDSDGKRGYVLTLSTREQHIRREKATSNICTNHGLCALAVTVNLSLLGKSGFEQTAHASFANAEYLKKGIAAIDGYELIHSGPTFNEFAVRCKNRKAAEVLEVLYENCILGGVDMGRFDPKMDDCILISTTECHDKLTLDTYLSALKK